VSRASQCEIERTASPANGFARAGVKNHLSAMALAISPAQSEGPAMQTPVRIAMWSGPRNISTAMMRAWGNRDDTTGIDEPFYAYYLKVTEIEHPGADEVLSIGETDWHKVVADLSVRIASGKRICFQKQMTHHLLPEIDRGWLAAATNCFLIRDPREVIHSYIKKREDPALEDLGFVQQAEIFEFVRSH